MALTITEASAVNVVLRHVLNVPNAAGEHDDPAKVVESAALLADHAYKALLAGMHGSTVHASAWARSIA